jgi:tetratricopeptide (TPR) repeat protein
LRWKRWGSPNADVGEFGIETMAMTVGCRTVTLALLTGLSFTIGASAQAEQLGRVQFKTSCSPEAQKQFERALAMLHSFYFPETVKTFSSIPAIDAGCAIAYWGIAISQRPNPLVGPIPAALLKQGLEAVEKGKAIGAKTERERDWLAAIEAYYKEFDKVDQDTRAKNYTKAMEALTRTYPDDVEAKIFYALALNETIDFADKTYANQLKAARILDAIDSKHADHPGVAHYLIHSLDFQPLAKRGLKAAMKYDKIAPSAPHALHMPSHIYTMLGMWEASIASNLKSIAVCEDYAAKNHPDATHPHVPHNYDFMQYAYLQVGQDGKAKVLVDTIATMKKLFREGLATETPLAAIPARYMLERQDWRGAAQLTPRGSKFPQAEAITHFARALGAARSGELPAAQADIEKLKELRTALEKTSQPYWAEQVELQALAALGWVAQAQGNATEALKFMRAAADLEDRSEKHVAMENRLYPMRELLGDLLLQQRQAADALGQYQASLKAAPERLRSFYGAANAAKAVGDRKMAMMYYRKLARLTRSGDSDRPELREMKQVLAQR